MMKGLVKESAKQLLLLAVCEPKWLCNRTGCAMKY